MEEDTGDVFTNVQEFLEEPMFMGNSFCIPIQTEDEYKKMSYLNTKEAIQGLLNYCKENPYIYKNILKKRKIEAIRSSGIFSSLKIYFWKYVFGEKYLNSLVSEEEFEEKFESLLKGIEVLQQQNIECFYECAIERSHLSATPRANDATQINKESPNVEKKNIEFGTNENSLGTSVDLDPGFPAEVLSGKDLFSGAENNISADKECGDSIGHATVPPPPPPPPMGILFRDSNAPTRKRKYEADDKTESRSAKKPLRKTTEDQSRLPFHDEIQKSDVKGRLKSTGVERSPGGTPINNPSSNHRSGDLAFALKKILEAKFANIRSPCSNNTSFNYSFNSFSE